jgi:thiamine-monophosphate kinase
MSLSEFDIIAKYFATQTAREDVRLGIGDDAAVLDGRSDRKLVLAMDTIVEGVHFPARTDAPDVGYRALAVNLSDLAAMGAEPSWMSLSLSIPRADEQWIEGFAQGLFELASEHRVQLIGGDTVRGPLVVTIQVGGWVESDRWLTRAGAKIGDALFVSGVPGEAAAGLQALQDGSTVQWADILKQRFLRPTPRVHLGRALRTIASSAMDISDGLLTDLRKLCAASQCGAILDVDRLPISSALGSVPEDKRLEYALAGGDDYELLFTAPPDAVLSGIGADVAITQIGTIVESRKGVRCVRNGTAFTPSGRGWDHFNE